MSDDWSLLSGLFCFAIGCFWHLAVYGWPASPIYLAEYGNTAWLMSCMGWFSGLAMWFDA